MVSVVILSYNNKEFLRKSITSALELDWPKLEVIVVDNASSDGTPEIVEEEFGKRVLLIRRSQNSPTAARNEGFNAARGDFILSIDNDIVLINKTVVRKAVSLFHQLPKVGVLAFKIGTTEDPDRPLREHWWHPVRFEDGENRFFYTDFFSEGAVFFRKRSLDAAGGYDESFFQYYEGNDLAHKMMRKGYDILYCPCLSCGELRVRGFLHQERRAANYLSIRNSIWIVWKYQPICWRAFFYVIGRIVGTGIDSMRFGWSDLFFKGARDGILAPKAVRIQRHPLSKADRRRIREIHRGIFCDKLVGSE